MRGICSKARVAAIYSIILSSMCGFSAVAQDGHFVSKSTWTQAPVPVEAMNRQIESQAEGLLRDLKREGLPTDVITRQIFWDIAYPANALEYRTLNGYGVILVTAFARDKAELPLQRVFVVSGKNMIELDRLSVILTEQRPDAAPAVIFGRYRADALYAFPVDIKRKPGKLRADFAKNRTDFDLAAFDGTIDEFLRVLPASSGLKGNVPQKEIEAFVRREYPGFIDQK